MTANGQVNTEVDYKKFGATSAQYDGNGDALTTPDNDVWDCTAHNCTIDWWQYLTAWNANDTQHLVGQLNVVPCTGNHWVIYTSNYSNFNDLNIGRNCLSELSGTNSTVILNQWQHLAAERNGTQTSLWVDGTRVAQAASIDYWDNSDEVLNIGGDTVYDITGYVDEFRFSNIARYSGAASFTPETAAYCGDANTTLLLHMDGADEGTTFTDDSTNYPCGGGEAPPPSWNETEIINFF